MKRDIIKIDEELCNGCGLCVPNCHEGALQVIDGKVRLISDLMCDGLGACIGHCPEGAITIEHREAEPYNETAVIEDMIAKGKNVIIAHLKHLKDHNETGFLNEGISYLKNNENNLNFDLNEVLNKIQNNEIMNNQDEKWLVDVREAWKELSIFRLAKQTASTLRKRNRNSGNGLCKCT